MIGFPNKKYKIIYVDPPWHFENYNDETATKWVGNHYSLMTVNELKELPIQQITEKDCALFLWATFPMLPQALEIIVSWGFTYKTVAFTWIKTNKNGKPFLGMGRWTRSNAEICLLATKGSPKRVCASISQVILSTREEHSKKPDVARHKIVRLLGDLSRIELFAREKIEGWDTWGLEVPNSIQLLLSKE